MNKKNTPSFRSETFEKINQKHKGNDIKTQVMRALEAFQLLTSLTTQDMRQDLDIMHPAGRVKELRAFGFDIRTYWGRYPTTCGKMHRMARYLYREKIHEKNSQLNSPK